jgi:deoxyguanosine kinase
MEKVFIGLGTNLGDREFNLKFAIEKIRELIGNVVHVSSVYETDPVGFISEERFLNMIIETETDLEPEKLLNTILGIETLIGRKRSGTGYSSRIIDLDIILFGDRITGDEIVTIPHPRMHERQFVLVPLCELAPELVHPVFRKSIKMLLDECPDRSLIQKYHHKLKI